MTLELIQQIAQAVERLGLHARVEYPGVVVVSGASREYWFGDVNEYWGATHTSGDITESFDTTVVSTETDPNQVAMATVAAVVAMEAS